MLALCPFVQTASAKPNCDVPHPPPICNRGGDNDPPPPPLAVRISVDGALVQTLTASGSRPDVAAAYPSYGAAHGYDVTVPASP